MEKKEKFKKEKRKKHWGINDNTRPRVGEAGKCSSGLFGKKKKENETGGGSRRRVQKGDIPGRYLNLGGRRAD